MVLYAIKCILWGEAAIIGAYIIFSVLIEGFKNKEK